MSIFADHSRRRGFTALCLALALFAGVIARHSHIVDPITPAAASTTWLTDDSSHPVEQHHRCAFCYAGPSVLGLPSAAVSPLPPPDFVPAPPSSFDRPRHAAVVPTHQARAPPPPGLG